MKSKTHSNNGATPHDRGNSELQEQIRRRAHAIWLAGGCEHGDDVRHWLEAERDVLAQIQRESRKRT